MYFFISFASEDGRVKEKVCSILYNLNIKYWVDNSEIEIGDNIERRINNAIKDTSAAIVIISNKYFKNNEAYPWCRHELSMMIDKSANNDYLILPIFLEAIDDIRKDLSTEDKELLNKLSKYHGLKAYEFMGDLAYKHLKEYLINKIQNHNGIIEDENGYFIFWGTEYGQLSYNINTPMNYLFIDTVHSDKGRGYVVIGKFELHSHLKQDENYNKEYHKTAMSLFKKYINKNKKTFHITFSDKSVHRKEFKISANNEVIFCSFTGRVNGIYPFGMDISINYAETLVKMNS
ncbi:toll/interleukin-1 receptor domain-containing protein [Paenibacillus sp. 2TAB26]|uniref:toll/interleukin-1 receptor domain-containing protein n=1 Tax=Paenibacillus sp. 2TAB26 TaxID=3233005 RepID=UPI003F950E62